MPLISNLNLNGATPPRMRPTIGEWGPEGVPGTRTKKRRRWIALTAFLVALLVVALMWWWVFHMMTGLFGFGFDD